MHFFYETVLQWYEKYEIWIWIQPKLKKKNQKQKTQKALTHIHRKPTDRHTYGHATCVAFI